MASGCGLAFANIRFWPIADIGQVSASDPVVAGAVFELRDDPQPVGLVALPSSRVPVGKFVITDHLKDSRSIVGYLDACLEEGGQPLFLEALGEVNKAVGGIATVTQTVSPPTTRE